MCYARVGVQGVGSGLQTLNVSPGIPPEVVQAFSRAQAGNLGAVTSVSPRGELRRARELRHAAGCSMLTQITYGVPDGMGRPSAFCHAYVVSSSQFAADPQALLGLVDENFGHTAQDTAVISSRLETRPHLDPACALAAAGLDAQRYEALLNAVWARAGAAGARGPGETLYLVCPEDAGRRLALLVCIYQGLPPALRARLSFCTLAANRGLPATLSFIESPQGKFFDVASGALGGSSAPEDSARNFPVCSVAARMARGCAWAELDRFFVALEHEAASFADEDVQDAASYQLAYEQLDESELVPGDSALACGFWGSPEARLAACLSVPRSADPSRAAQRDHLVSLALGEVVDVGAGLDEACAAKLDKALATTELPELRDTGIGYRALLIAGMGVGDGAAELYRLYPDTESRADDEFKSLVFELKRTHGELGQKIVNQYYDTWVAFWSQLSGTISVQDVVSFRAEIRSLGVSLWEGAFGSIVEEHLKQVVYKRALRPSQLNDEIDSFVAAAELEENEASYVRENVLDYFWATWPFDTCDFGLGEAEVLASPIYPECGMLVAAEHCVEAVRAGHEELLADELDNYSEFAQRITPEQLDGFGRRLADELVRLHNPYRVFDFDLWSSAVTVLCGRDECTAYLLRHGILPTDRDSLEEVARVSTRLSSPESLVVLTADLERLVKEKGPEADAAAAALRSLKALAKRRRREERKASHFAVAQDIGPGNAGPRETENARGLGKGDGVFGFFRRGGHS